MLMSTITKKKHVNGRVPTSVPTIKGREIAKI